MKTRTHMLCAALLGLMTFGLTGCYGPLKVERFVEIGAAETVFIIPLEGGTDEQSKTDSVTFLEKSKVNAKRITIPQRKHNYGYAAGSFKWVPTVRAIKVNRAPVTREWTEESTAGTSDKNESLEVQSEDGVMFGLGANITCRIEEEDTALYLYHFGTVPEADDKEAQESNSDIIDLGWPLAEVVDNNVRSYMQSRLFYYFSEVTLDEAKEKKIDFFQLAHKDATAYFKTRGVTIDAFGSTKGLNFVNNLVQDAINKKFLVENAKQVALQDKAEAQKLNQKKVDMAIASRKSAEEFLQAKDAMLMSYSLEIQMIRAQARKAMAENWDGQMPQSILPGGNQQMLLNLQDVK